MINSEARAKAAQLLRQLRDGVITNDEFEDGWPGADGDRALRAIGSMLWRSYSDLEKHKLTDQHAPSDEDRMLFERCALFLEANLEYQWPIDNFRTSAPPGIIAIALCVGMLLFGLLVMDREGGIIAILSLLGLTLAAWERRKSRHQLQKMAQAGDVESWPFLRPLDYESAANCMNSRTA